MLRAESKRKRFPFAIDADGSWPRWLGVLWATGYAAFVILDWPLLIFIATVGPLTVIRAIRRPALELTEQGVRLLRPREQRTIPWSHVARFEAKGHYIAFDEELADGGASKHAFTGVSAAHRWRAASLFRAQITARAFD